MMYTTTTDEKKVIIIIGHTQTAKSSTIKDLTGDLSIACGKLGNGGSTTKAIKIYQPITPKLKDEYIFMDTIGPGDNTLKFTPENIREEIELNILALSSTNKCDKIQGIVITESLKESSHQLRNNLKFITQIFGDLPNKSLVILGTKGHKQDQDDIHERQNALMEIMKQFNIPQNQYIRFDTSYPKLPQQSINEQQYKQLEAALKNCSMINANKSIKEKKNKIDEIAKKIQKEKTQIKKQEYIHTWTEQRWDGDLGKILGIKKDKVFSQPRQHTIIHVPKLEQCYGLALKQFEQGVRQKLLMMN